MASPAPLVAPQPALAAALKKLIGTDLIAHDFLVGGKIMCEQILAKQRLERSSKARLRGDQRSRMTHQRSIVPVRRIFRCNCITP